MQSDACYDKQTAIEQKARERAKQWIEKRNMVFAIYHAKKNKILLQPDRNMP